jgi:hypothetical protein
MLRLPIDEIVEETPETLDIPPAAMGIHLTLQIVG